MNPLEEECARLTIEQRTLYLPNSGCVERGRQFTREGGKDILTITYAQRPGFCLPRPFDTQEPTPPNTIRGHYSAVPYYRNVQVRVPRIES